MVAFKISQPHGERDRIMISRKLLKYQTHFLLSHSTNQIIKLFQRSVVSALKNYASVNEGPDLWKCLKYY